MSLTRHRNGYVKGKSRYSWNKWVFLYLPHIILILAPLMLLLWNCVHHGKIQNVIPVQMSVDVCTPNSSLKLSLAKYSCWKLVHHLLKSSPEHRCALLWLWANEPYWEIPIWMCREGTSTQVRVHRSWSVNWDYRWQGNRSSVNMPVKMNVCNLRIRF